METVDVIASGYDWYCENCEVWNHIIELPNRLIIKCRICKTRYKISDYDHAYE